MHESVDQRRPITITIVTATATHHPPTQLDDAGGGGAGGPRGHRRAELPSRLIKQRHLRGGLQVKVAQDGAAEAGGRVPEGRQAVAAVGGGGRRRQTSEGIGCRQHPSSQPIVLWHQCSAFSPLLETGQADKRVGEPLRAFCPQGGHGGDVRSSLECRCLAAARCSCTVALGRCHSARTSSHSPSQRGHSEHRPLLCCANCNKPLCFPPDFTARRPILPQRAAPHAALVVRLMTGF